MDLMTANLLKAIEFAGFSVAMLAIVAVCCIWP